ncbi:hypothetical protein PR202_gb15971 [Eleusine coracana subsp. coracana]|uniref:TFIIS N-terminal domain-containing protein n=1 Tax=Eleusine coracana subsp. coracana TaxID=191504 RepID=A0AAV5EZN7_ELECO|nr:hypothetical protein QOZ80_6AG0524800 [Eleusine coracana subsp. coracana]GJN27908.1 hypothetical protein PR202_gb15971 [Eleusine coracana subsp. coracana]
MVSILGRWTRSLACFDHIDAAIEAADPWVSRDEFRRLRAQIVERLRFAADDKAEGLRVILDGVMAESLVTLQSVPSDVIPSLLASSADLANAVGALRNHGSERVRGLAREVISGWRASVEDDIARMTGAMAKLDALSPPNDSKASNVSDGRGHKAPFLNLKTKNIREEDKPCPKIHSLPVKHQTKIQQSSQPPTKKMDPVCTLPKKTVPRPEEERMEATKRKLHQGYQEAADAKRQHKIQVIEAPKMVMEQRQGKTIMRERSRADCGNAATAVRRSLLSSFGRV